MEMRKIEKGGEHQLMEEIEAYEDLIPQGNDIGRLRLRLFFVAASRLHAFNVSRDVDV